MEKKLQVIGHGSSNGVDLNRFDPSGLNADKLEEIKKMLRYDDKLHYLLNMGRIVKDKGVEEVLKAFKIVHAANPDLRLILLGAFEEDLDPVSEEAVNTIKTHPAIIHIDWTDQVEYFMHLSKLLIHASYREGFPNTLLQAGAMNCPIMCTAIEGSMDIVTNKETGLVFEDGNAPDLQKHLEYALTHQEEMKQYATNLRSKIEKYFNQSYLHFCLKEKYLELLNDN